MTLQELIRKLQILEKDFKLDDCEFKREAISDRYSKYPDGLKPSHSIELIAKLSPKS